MKGAGRKEKTQKEDTSQMGLEVMVKNTLLQEKSPRDRFCQNKAVDLKASPWKQNREENTVFKKDQSVENLLDYNKMPSNVSFIKVPEENMKLKIIFLKKLTKENAVSLGKRHKPYVFFEYCKLCTWGITADMFISMDAITCKRTQG